MLRNIKTSILKQNCEICPIILTQKRKQLEREKKDTCLILHDTFTLLTVLLVSEISKKDYRQLGGTLFRK